MFRMIGRHGLLLDDATRPDLIVVNLKYKVEHRQGPLITLYYLNDAKQTVGELKAFFTGQIPERFSAQAHGFPPLAYQSKNVRIEQTSLPEYDLVRTIDEGTYGHLIESTPWSDIAKTFTRAA